MPCMYGSLPAIIVTRITYVYRPGVFARIRRHSSIPSRSGSTRSRTTWPSLVRYSTTTRRGIGSSDYETEVGRGTAFRIRLPVRSERTASLRVAATGAAPRPLRVLVVDACTRKVMPGGGHRYRFTACRAIVLRAQASACGMSRPCAGIRVDSSRHAPSGLDSPDGALRARWRFLHVDLPEGSHHDRSRRLHPRRLQWTSEVPCCQLLRVSAMAGPRRRAGGDRGDRGAHRRTC